VEKHSDGCQICSQICIAKKTRNKNGVQAFSFSSEGNAKENENEKRRPNTLSNKIHLSTRSPNPSKARESEGLFGDVLYALSHTEADLAVTGTRFSLPYLLHIDKRMTHTNTNPHFSRQMTQQDLEFFEPLPGCD